MKALAAQQSIDLPRCDVQSQREVVGEAGGQISDPRQAYISVRANILNADIGSSRKARYMTSVEADRMIKCVDAIRSQTNRFVKLQGFSSAAEKTSFDRELDAIAMQLCREKKERIAKLELRPLHRGRLYGAPASSILLL